MSPEQVSRTIVDCFNDAGIYRRSENRPIVETEVAMIDSRQWVVAAAGLDTSNAERYFGSQTNRADRVREAVSIQPQGRLEILFILRPVDPANEQITNPDRIVRFAPGRHIPFVEVGDGSFLRFDDLPDTHVPFHSLRWELDERSSHQRPLELWLTDWYEAFYQNPAHPAAHLHVDSLSNQSTKRTRSSASSQPELRLAMGIPNPLAMIMSVAVRLRSQL